jgi:phosphatidate cytidylyltransferase
MTVSILFAPPLFMILILLIATGMLIEWFELTKSSFIHLLLGLIIIPIPIISLLLVNVEYDSRWILFSYFVAIWSVDTFAMIGGKKLKGPKLAPKLSPNKTWSGLIIGVVSSGTVVVVISTIPSFNIPDCSLFDKTHLILNCMFIAFIAQMSDLFISYFKRKFDVKESGVLIPGHGGVLDRFDSIILTAPILYFAVHCS